MSKWSKFKAMLLAGSVLAALQFPGCGFINMNRILQLVAVGSIFD
jgi:hypothetical protein